MWRYLGLGRYGEQIEHLLTLFLREQLHVVRYRDLVETPGSVLAGVCRFLDVPDDVVTTIPPVQVSIFAPRRGRGGIGRGRWFSGRSTPRLDPNLPGLPGPDAPQRPELTSDERRSLIEYFADDIRHLEELLGRSFWDWFSDEGSGTYTRRRGALTRRLR